MKNFTKGKLKRRISQVEASIEHYLNALDNADRQEVIVSNDKVASMQEKLVAMKAKLAELKQREVEVLSSPHHQVSLTDPDARSMATSHDIGMVGYNVQSAVDTEHHLIVSHEVSNIVSDKLHLSRQAAKAKAAMGRKTLDVYADRGYFSGTEIIACKANDITAYAPKPLTSGSRAAGRYGKDEFTYIPDENVYRCPAGEKLTYRFENTEHGRTLHSYWTTKCETCHLKPRCTTGNMRRIKRWEHEGVIDKMLNQLDEKDAMTIRRRTVEHPFGTMKAGMGATHFLMKGLKNVQTEMSLSVLAYNIKRMIAIMGVRPLIAAIKTA